MSGITVTATATPITASASGGQVNASVASTVVSASFSGGIGPQGPSGSSGGSLDELGDVVAPTPSAGDVLRWSSSAWRNFPEVDLSLDGGNF